MYASGVSLPRRSSSCAADVHSDRRSSASRGLRAPENTLARATPALLEGERLYTETTLENATMDTRVDPGSPSMTSFIARTNGASTPWGAVVSTKNTHASPRTCAPHSDSLWTLTA